MIYILACKPYTTSSTLASSPQCETGGGGIWVVSTALHRYHWSKFNLSIWTCQLYIFLYYSIQSRISFVKIQIWFLYLKNCARYTACNCPCKDEWSGNTIETICPKCPFFTFHIVNYSRIHFQIFKYCNYTSKRKLGWFPHSPKWITFIIFILQKKLLNIKDVEFNFSMCCIFV